MDAREEYKEQCVDKARHSVYSQCPPRSAWLRYVTLLLTEITYNYRREYWRFAKVLRKEINVAGS